jgi:hypothetical protein
MIFQVYQEEEKDGLNDMQKKYPMKHIVDRANAAKLDTRCFYSCQRDEVYVKFRGSPDRLYAEADRINYKLLLDTDRLRIRSEQGAKDGSWKGVTITDEKVVSTLEPYEYIYGKYCMSPELQALYKTYPMANKRTGIFRSIDRYAYS